MTEPAFLSARALARRIKSGKVGCLELVEYFIDRVERFDSKLNAVVVRDFETARKRARAMDRRLKRGEASGPLFGVPMTVKESYDVVGLPTTRGLVAFKESRATQNALAVERMLAAGANVFGKTNVPVHLSDWQTFNPIYGTTNNPWDVTRTPGGSSGGSAAALAAGLTGLEIGSDVGASIRNPAHYCGVYGHKSTWGICSRRGHSLNGSVAEPDISVLGPLGRSAGDLAVALTTMAGPDEIDGAGWKLALPKPRRVRLRDYRVAVMPNHPTAPVDKSVENAVLAVADYLRSEKAKVSLEARPAIDPAEAHELYLLLFRADTVGILSPEKVAHFREERAKLDPGRHDYYAELVRASTLSHGEWLKLNERRHRMRHRWAEFFREWDVLLCPPAATVAFPHNPQGERWERMIDVNGSPQPSTTQLFWAGWPGVAYLPATVAPAATGPHGLPIGVQIIGPQHGDLTTIDFAAHLERGFRAFLPPPGY